MKLEEIMKYNATKREYCFPRLIDENEDLYIELFNLMKNNRCFDIEEYLRKKKLFDITFCIRFDYNEPKFLELYEGDYKGWEVKFEYKKIKYKAYIDQKENVNRMYISGMDDSMDFAFSNNLEELYNSSISFISKKRTSEVNFLRKEIQKKEEKLKRVEKKYDDIMGKEQLDFSKKIEEE